MATGTIPTRHIQTRRIAFAYPEGEVPRHFMGGEPAHSHVLAVLSSMFPEGEDFFVRSVRNYRDQVTDPELKRQVAGFIGQEAIHGREHRTFNERLAAMGYPTRFVDRFVKHSLAFEARVRPKSHQLAITAALEHYTATFAELLLRTPELVEMPRTDEVRFLLLWHAIEESEHKAVAFDVFQEVSGSRNVRVWVMRLISVGFLVGLVSFTALSLLLDGHTYRHPVRTVLSVRRLRKAPWLRNGLVGRLRDYNRRDFHPDDHDTTELLEEWRSRLFGAEGTLAERLKGAPAA
jgi:predicted metal-dependent hydrolase